MKKYRKIVITIVIILLAGAGIASAFRKPKGPNYLTTPAQRMDLVQTVDATGSISSAEDIALNFKSTGRIASVRVAVGDRVKQGQVLADLSSGDLQSAVTSAQASVRSAEADLEKLMTGSTAEQIAVNQEEVANAQIALDSVKTKLQNLELTQQKTRDEYRSTALQALTDKQFVAQYALDTIYDDLLDQEATDLFRTTRTASLASARSRHANASASLQSVKALITAAQTSLHNESVLDALEALQKALSETSFCISDGLDALSGAIVTSSYSSTTIDTMKLNASTQSTAVATAKTTVQTSISNLTIGEQELQKAYDDAIFAVKTAEGTLNLAKAKLNLTTAKPQSYEIKQAQARVAQAQASLQAALSNLSDTVITAPIDGTVTAVDIKVGEQASLSKTSIMMIGESLLEIKVDIPESDITKLATGDPAEITLDAFGPETKFQGTVQFIEPAERLIEGVVYYRVTININEASVAIKPGMTANITITTETKPGVLVAPARAVLTDGDGIKRVRILTASNEVVEKVVTTGLRGDGGMLEIVSGLNEGENVITGEQK